MVGRGGYLSVLLLGLCQAGFLVTLILSFLPSSAVTAWASPAIEFTFLHDTARSLWAISSVASLAAFGRGLV